MKLTTSKLIRHGMPSSKKQAGLTILEVLIALVILSIGLVGLAGMHLNSMQYVHSAYFRSLASSIALDFEERSWRELAKVGVTNCLDVSTTGLAFSTLAADWKDRSYLPDDHWTGWSGEKQATMPNVDIAAPDSEATPPIFTETPVTLTWSDARFDSIEDVAIVNESDRDETYVYNIRILCKLSTTTAGPS